MSDAAPPDGLSVPLKLAWLLLIAVRCCSLLLIWLWPPLVLGPAGFAGVVIAGAPLPFAGATCFARFFRGWASIPIAAVAATLLTILNLYGTRG